MPGCVSAPPSILQTGRSAGNKLFFLLMNTLLHIVADGLIYLGPKALAGSNGVFGSQP